jgi:hypothetical protein
MELTRRKFGKILAASAVAVLSGVWKVAGRMVPASFIRAVKAKSFPGRIRALDEAEVKGTAKWGG